MSENKIDRANLRRQAQRIESYRSLISKQRSTLKSNMTLKKPKYEETSLKDDVIKYGNKENEDEKTSKDIHISSPGSSAPSCSSDSSQEFQPNLCTSLKAIQNMPYQSELEVTSVMTRSASKKYASVGAIHNRVNIDQELKSIKPWPSDIAYPVPEPPTNHLLLRDVVNKSFNEVISFCKNAVVPDNKDSNKTLEEVDDLWETKGETASYIDLSSYLTEEPVIINGNDETQITLHLNDSFIPHQFINIISLNEEEQSGTLVIEEGNEEYETITLHSGETYLVDNKYFSNTNSTCFNPNVTKTVPLNTFPDDPMMAVHNDHTYAQKYVEKEVVSEPQASQGTPPPNNEENEFKLENALSTLLFNTAILKCIICNETPQEVISHLEVAQSYL